MKEVPLYEIKGIGKVKEIKHNTIKVEGLPNCIFGQSIYLPRSNIKGLVVGFIKEEVFVLPFSSTAKINLGEPVEGRAGVFKLGVAESFLGRVVNSLALPLDGGSKIKPEEYLPVFAQGRPVLDRLPLTAMLPTGIKVLDSLISIGRGQRELIIGDRQTGKTSIVVDTIINQKKHDTICIYCWIGGNTNDLLKIIQLFKQKKVMPYTVLIDASASSCLGEQYLAPYTAATVGEYFMQKGKNVLVAFDDLTKHAWSYRQLSLLLGRFPGREAYPGDIFYIHSQLMERAGRLIPQLGGGTMTFLPVAETLQGDITGYIQSNLVSMTDGQIYLSKDLLQQGFRPAVDIGLSVSRIGSRVQPQALKEVSRGLRLDYLQYKKLLNLLRLRTRLADEVKQKLERGRSLVEVLGQLPNHPIEFAEEVVLFYAFQRKVLEILSSEGRKKFIKEIYDYLKSNKPELVEELNKNRQLSDGLKEKLNQEFSRFCQKNRVF